MVGAFIRSGPAIACFDQALGDVGVTDARLIQVLHEYFAWATRTAMSRFDGVADVRTDLTIPRWSWDGLVSGTGPLES